ncbi:MAG: energy transducer TonB [Desulfuromonadaceae bacterium]|nr:energy transducer TonB [Desulfuromonadaceae bacterium]
MGEELLQASFGTREGPKVVGLKPEYPLRARRLNKEGLVLVQLHLDRKGKLNQARVVEKAGYGFDEAALTAVKEAKFLPASRNGQSVACLALLPIRFRLRAGL